MKGVYVVETNGVYKIGHSEDVTKRIKDMQTGNPSEVSIVHTFDADKAPGAEKFLHRIFKNKRIRYEWFSLSLNDIAFIRSISSYSGGSFTWYNAPVVNHEGDNKRPVAIFKFIDPYREVEFCITERQVFDFLQTAWKRQRDKAHPLSSSWYVKRNTPRLKHVQYDAIMAILVDNSIVINRHQGTSGHLSMSPNEAMQILIDPAQNKYLSSVHRLS